MDLISGKAPIEEVFVGRAIELAELEAGLVEARSGRGRLFLIAGEPGIGKSRLADELARRAALQGARVLWGRCWEAGGAPAYWPWVQAIRAYVRDREQATLAAELARGAVDIAQLLPELRDLLPGLAEPVSLDPEGARFRLFDSTTTFLRNAGQAQPLLLILDDLHAADAPSLLMLGFMASELVHTRLVVIGAYREEELLADRQLAPILVEMGRGRAVRHVRLTGLSEREVAEFIEETVAEQTPDNLATMVFGETEGNPLFVREVIQLLVAEERLGTTLGPLHSPMAIPSRIREAIDRRLDLLPDRCRGVLAIASVLGGAFRLDVLANVAGLSAETLLDVLDTAMSTRVLIDVPGSLGRRRFSHSLVRDVLYEDLPPTRRTQLHERVGETLECLYAAEIEPQLAELAHHFCAALPGGNADKAIDYAQRAGARAAALLAYEEGVRLFSLALRVLETTAGHAGVIRCDLLLSLGDAQAREGDLAGARQTFLEAAGIARREQRRPQLAAAALGYGGRFVWARAGSDPHLVPLLEEALMAQPVGDSAIRARLMSRLAGALRDTRSPEEQDRQSQAAVEMARRIGDAATISYTLEGRYAATWWPDNPEERLELAREILQLAKDANDAERTAQGWDWWVSTLVELGDMASVDVELETAARLVEELRQPAQRWLLMNAYVMLALFHGDFDEAERLIAAARDLGQRAQQWDAVYTSRLQMYLLRREQGRQEEMEDVIKRSIAEYPTRSAMRALGAHLYAELGRSAEARRAFEALAVDGFDRVRRDNDWLFTMSLLPEVARELGDVEQARILYDVLVPFAGRHATTSAEASTGSLSRSLGILAGMLERWDDAARLFDAAIEWNKATGARPWVAHAQVDYAKILLAHNEPGDRARAAELLAVARRTTHQLGMLSLDRTIAVLTGASETTTADADGGDALERDLGTLRREGEYWSVRFGGDAFQLKDAKGLRYLATLLGSPDREFLALELATTGRGAGATPPADLELRTSSRGEPLLDRAAKSAYQGRLVELQAEIDEADAWADTERAARLSEEMDALTRELAAAIGLFGRDRRTSSDAERARVNVTKAVRAAIARIGEHSPELQRHLAATIRTGMYCSYRPDPRFSSGWRL